jgi:ATP-dependent RNA helicase DDX27
MTRTRFVSCIATLNTAQRFPTQQPKRDKFSGLSRRAKRRKLAAKDDEELADTGALKAAIRTAKKLARPPKIGIADKRNSKPMGKIKKSRKVISRAGAAFETDRRAKSVSGEGVRAKRGQNKSKGEKA